MSNGAVFFRRGDFAIGYDPWTGALALEKNWGSNGLDALELTPLEVKDLQQFLRYVIENTNATAVLGPTLEHRTPKT